MGPDERPDAAPAAQAFRGEVSVLRRILQRHGRALVIAFVCIALPLWTFGELADEVLEDGPLPFDEPTLRLMREASAPWLDRASLALAAVGFAWGVVPADVVLVATLVLRGRLRAGAFAALALAGSGLLNMAAKHVIARDRPSLWASIAPEATYSFPSGHAMGAATLATVCAVLAWRSRYRAAVLAVGVAFAFAVGASRVYLGVHYPSDIIAGWCAAVAWVMACHLVIARPKRPDRGPADGATHNASDARRR